jgi:hypothetical protein
LECRHTVVKIGNLKIENGIFKNDKQVNREPYSYFDGQNILFSEINGEITDARFVGDSIFSKLKLSAKERSGFELKNLTADLKMTPKEMAFSTLTLLPIKALSVIHSRWDLMISVTWMILFTR